jgi:hypothetical protein
MVFLQVNQIRARSNPESSKTNQLQSDKKRERQNDFDFEIGVWKTNLRRLLNPLTGSNT